MNWGKCLINLVQGGIIYFGMTLAGVGPQDIGFPRAFGLMICIVTTLIISEVIAKMDALEE